MLVTMKAILDDANKHTYGVMAMNSINIEMIRGAIMGAAEANSPIIIQCGPNQIKTHAHMEEIVPLVHNLASRVHVPVALNLDHGSKFEDINKALQMGFTNVMFDGSSLSFEENITKTEIVVALAHAKGVSVEAELGHVGQAIDEDDLNFDYLTKADVALEFIERTSVDCLAVAIGTAHGSYPKGKIPKLNFEILDQIKRTTKIPLVLHGGSGAGEENLKKAVELGINKINVATDAFSVAKNAFLKAVEQNPNMDYMQISAYVENEIKEFVINYTKIIKSYGRFTYGDSVSKSKE